MQAHRTKTARENSLFAIENYTHPLCAIEISTILLMQLF
jgi:hypothetical protein